MKKNHQSHEENTAVSSTADIASSLEGETPESLALGKEFFDVIDRRWLGGAKTLVKKGASLRVQNSDGHTPLSYAMAHADSAFSILSFLLEQGADVTMISPDRYQELLHKICWKACNLETVKFLAKQDAVDINAIDKSGRTALSNAVECNQAPQNAAFLLDCGADIFMGTSYAYNTVLHHAVMHGSSEMVETLIQHGIPVDVLNKNGYTPLFSILEFHSANSLSFCAPTPKTLEKISILLKHGADIHIKQYMYADKKRYETPNSVVRRWCCGKGDYIDAMRSLLDNHDKSRRVWQEWGTKPAVHESLLQWLSHDSLEQVVNLVEVGTTDEDIIRSVPCSASSSSSSSFR